MKKSRIMALTLVLIMLVACFSAAISVSAADSDWVSVGNSSKPYAYSMAVIGDTQTLSISDAKNYDTVNEKFNDGYEPRLEKVYDWLVANKDSKDIRLVMGLGDIVETWQSRQDWTNDKYAEYWDLQDLEWDLDKAQIKKLADANIPFTIVRGNHDSDKAFHEEIGGFTAYTDQLVKKGGFYKDAQGNTKYDTSYMKLTLGKTNWLVIQLDWAVTTAELDWAAKLITDNPDYSVILTMHNYLYNDATVDGKTGSADTAKPNPKWDYSIDPTSANLDPDLVFNPDGIWHRLVSKYENIKLVISGHVPNDNIQHSQLIGDNGNTVTQLLVDPQSMDLDSKNAGGCGMVCMLYFREDGTLVDSWDEKNIDVEWYSTIKEKFYKANNQFTIDVDLYDGGVETDYGIIPKEFADAEAYPFAVFARDVDINECFFTGAYANWTTSAGGAYPSLSNFSGKSGVESVILLRRDFDTSSDTAYSNFGNYGLTVNLDLGGHTFMSKYNETAKKDLAIFQTNLKRNVKTTINVYGKEGSALLNGSKWSSIVTLGIASKDANGAVFTYNFDGIEIGFGAGGASAKLISQTYDGAAGSAYTVNQYLYFNNCTFKLTAEDNRPSGAVTLFHLNETVGATVGNSASTVTINGGKIEADTMSDITIATKNANDNVFFGTDKNGNYTTFAVSDGASPTEAYTTPEGERLEYVPSADGAYTLKKTASSDAGSLGEIDVWLIGGQSNAAGYGSDGLSDSFFDIRYKNGFDNIIYYGAGDNNKVTDFVPLTVGLGNKATSVGAEVGIAKMLGDTDGMNAVIKLGRGSSALYPKTTGDVSVTYGTWTSPSYIKNNGIATDGTKIGALYADFLATVKEGIDILKARGYTPVIRGMWWMQGEAECSDAETSAAYAELLECLITDLRIDIEKNTGVESSDMPFVAGNILRNGTKDANGNFIYSQPQYLKDINAAQATVAEKLDRVYTVATAGLPQIDNWHFTADAQSYLGEEFVKAVVRSGGKYLVSIDGTAVSGEGLGEYVPGESVTVTLEGINGCTLTKAYFVSGDLTPVEIPVSNGKASYTFVMPDEHVVFLCESVDPNAESTKHGVIPSDYKDAQKYPFVLFKNGKFFAAYESWNLFLDAGSTIFVADPKDEREADLLLRRDYNTSELSASSQGLFTIEGHINFDLDGFTVTRGGYHLFQIMAKKTSGKVACTSLRIYNGTILAHTSAPFIINTNSAAGVLEDHFYFEMDGVHFGFAEGASSAFLVLDTYANGTVDTKVSATFKNCTFDAKEYAPSKEICIFDLEENSGSQKSADITVVGGSIKIGDSSNDTVYRVGAGDKFIFGKSTGGNYTSLNITSGSAPDALYESATDGIYLKYGNGVSESDGTVTYNLTEVAVENIGGYGAIDSSEYPKQTYPFVLFIDNEDGSYTFFKAYAHFYDFLVDLRFNAPNAKTVLCLRDSYKVDTSSGDAKDVVINGTTYKNNDRNFYYLKKPLTIDLGGNTLTRGNLHTLQMMGNGTSVTITVKNGTLHTASGTMIPFNNTTGGPETTTLNFEGVTFTTVNLQYPLIDAYTGGSGETTTTANITFTNCTFDISALNRGSTSKATLFDAKDDNDRINFTINIVGGKFISGDKGYTNVNLFTANEGNDTLTFKRNGDGNYTAFEVKKGTAAPTYSFVSGESGEPKLTLFADFSIFTAASSTETHNRYFLDEAVSLFGYTNLPKSLSDTTFLVFDADKTAFIGFNTWYEMWSNIWTLRRADDIVVLMLRDYDTDNCAKSSQDVFAAKNMTIDLCGNTLTRGNNHIFQLYEKGTNATYAPNILVKNGNIVVKKNYNTLMYFNSSPSASGIDLTFNFTFDDVSFSSADGYIGRLVAEAHETNGVNGIKAIVIFNECDFTVGKKVDSIFTLNDKNEKYGINVNINGGVITYGAKAPIALLGEGDSLTFGKLDGAYTKLLASDESFVPSGAYKTAEGHECVFVKSGESDGYVNYSLYHKALIGYKVKSSVTLHSELVYNIYIPVANLSGFTVNGSTHEYETVELDGKEYCKVKIDLPAKEALSDINLKVNLKSGDTEVSASWTLNLIKYAEKVIGDTNTAEANLVSDILSYARAAYDYFGVSDAEKIAKVNALLGENYDENNAPVMNGSVDVPTEGLKAATFVLSSTPSIRFYLADGADASKYTFFADGKKLGFTEGSDSNGAYAQISVFAYLMGKTVEYRIDGIASGSYHINSYYSYAKTLNDEKLVTLVERFAKYCESAEEYRLSVIGTEN